MIVFGQSESIRVKVVGISKVVLFVKRWLCSCKLEVFGQNWLYSGKVVVFGQKWFH